MMDSVNLTEAEIKRTIASVDVSNKGLSGLEDFKKVIAAHKKKHSLSEDEIIFALVMSINRDLDKESPRN